MANENHKERLERVGREMYTEVELGVGDLPPEQRPIQLSLYIRESQHLVTVYPHERGELDSIKERLVREAEHALGAA